MKRQINKFDDRGFNWKRRCGGGYNKVTTAKHMSKISAKCFHKIQRCQSPAIRLFNLIESQTCFWYSKSSKEHQQIGALTWHLIKQILGPLILFYKLKLARNLREDFFEITNDILGLPTFINNFCVILKFTGSIKVH